MKKKVLIVDSDVKNIKLLGKFLTKHSFLVLVATNTKQGIAIAKAKMPDIIISEVRVPEINGLDLYEVLKKNKSVKNIPFIFISSTFDDQFIKSAQKTDYISKRCSPEELLIKINNHLHLSPSKKIFNHKKNMDFTILVVDDIEVNRNLIEEILADQSLRILKSPGGEDSIKKIKENEIDLILLDIEMPGMDGWKTFDFYKKMGIIVPVWAVTAHSDRVFEKKCYEYGFKEVVSKPIDITKLKNSIEKIRTTTLRNAVEVKKKKSVAPAPVKKKKPDYLDTTYLMRVTKNDIKLRKQTYTKFYKNVCKLHNYFTDSKLTDSTNELLRRELHTFINLAHYFCKNEIVKKAKQFEQQFKHKPKNSSEIITGLPLFFNDLKKQLEKLKF